MTIEECYTAMGANYQDVLRRFYKPDMIRRFARMFLQDTSFQQLTDAMARQDVKDAFLAAHTLKGVCLKPRLQQPHALCSGPDGDPPRGEL